MAYTVVQHPVLAHKLTQLRARQTSSADFRRLVSEMSTILTLEASRALPLTSVPSLESPIATYTGHQIALRVGIAPILRAGIGMTNAVLDLFPEASVFYLGLYREKVSLQPVEYYQKLPPQPTCDIVYLLDPLVATGGTATAAVTMLVRLTDCTGETRLNSVMQLDWGLRIDQIKLVVLLGSKPGLDAVASQCPGLEIFVAGVDEKVCLFSEACTRMPDTEGDS